MRRYKILVEAVVTVAVEVEASAEHEARQFAIEPAEVVNAIETAPYRLKHTKIIGLVE